MNRARSPACSARRRCARWPTTASASRSPTRSRARKPSGQDLRRARSSAALVVSIPHGRTITHANLGIRRDHLEGKSAATYALAIERLGERGVDVGVEVFGQGSESPWIGTGARYAIEPEKLFVDFSFAVQSGGNDARLLTLGLKYSF